MTIQRRQVTSFRVPNSVIQGLTTTTPTDLNRLTAFEMVTLIGLFTLVSPKSAELDVKATVGELLDIIEVSSTVAQVAERTWETADGQQRSRRYRASRKNPAYHRKINDALLSLFEKQIEVRTYEKSGGRHVLQFRNVHLLESFGYDYVVDGRQLDLDRLPPGYAAVNVDGLERRVRRVRRSDSSAQMLRPRRVYYRFPRELTAELRGTKGTICSTIVARQIFGLFRTHMRSPATIRMILLVVRQTDEKLTRQLRPMMADIGLPVDHLDRAVNTLREITAALIDDGLIADVEVDVTGNRFRATVVRNWYRNDAADPDPVVEQSKGRGVFYA
jgi:hypothetical protein